MRHKKRPTFETKMSAVKAVVEDKISPKTVAGWHEVHFTNVYSWVRKYLKTKSYESLKRNHRGGTKFKIDPAKAKRIISLIMKPATEFGFSDELWTTKRLCILCKKEFKISVSHVTVWNFLKRYNFSYKKPEKQYNEGDPKELQDWLSNTLPESLEKVRKYRGILYFLDESKIQMSSFNGKTWSPKGTCPVSRVSGRRDSINAISAISQSGFLLFNLWDCNIDSDIVISFLKQMLNFHARRHLFVLMDNAPGLINTSSFSFK